MKAMIVAPQPVAVEAGFEVLRGGGNAVDAAVTCALVQGVVSPHMCGVGGYAVVTLSPGGGAPIFLDGPALAGSLVTPEMWQDRLLRPSPHGWSYFLKGRVNDIGYPSVCTPGAVKLLATLLERYGTLDWEQAIAPAVQVAEEGFTVGQQLAAGWKARRPFPEATSLLERILSNEEARRLYLMADGRAPDEADTIHNPDYGATLRRLAEAGPDDFYHGELAGRMARDLGTNGSFVTAGDLAGYALQEPPVVTGSYRGVEVASAASPHGGPTLVATLNILEHFDLAALEHNSAEYIHLVAMAMKAAFADRNLHLGDPAFHEVPLEWMIGKDRAAEWAAHIRRGDPITVSFTPSGPPDTTTLSVVDGAGTWLNLTHSLGSSSGVITPGLGFMYNNSMTNFHPLPGHPNSIAPGKGRTSGMAPTLLSRDGEPFMTVGAPGSTQIITGVLQVVLNVLDFGMGIQEAVYAPRFDCQGELIRCQARIPEYICAEVARLHPIARTPYSHGSFGLVHAIARDPASGRLSGGADTGAGGMALGL